MAQRSVAPTHRRPSEAARVSDATGRVSSRLVRAAATAATMAIVSGVAVSCASDGAGRSARKEPGATTTTAQESAASEPSTSTEAGSQLPESAESATPAEANPATNPQPNPQVEPQVPGNFPSSIPLPESVGGSAATAPPGSPPESSASLVVGQELAAALQNYRTQLQSAGWNVIRETALPAFGELAATRSDAQLTALFSPGDAAARTVVQIVVKGDAG